MNSSCYRKNENETRSNSSRIVAGGGSIVSQHHPFSSTPAITPLVSAQMSVNTGSGMDIRSLKANMKLPVGSLASNNSSTEELINQSMAMLGVGGGKRRPNVTVRDRYNNCDASSTSIISPIVPTADGGRNNVQFTEPRGLRKLFPGGGDETSNGDSANSTGSKTMFPYPKVTVPGFDPGEILCEALKTLTAFKVLEGENQRLHGVQKRKEKQEEKVVPYDFVKDTFVAVNSEAANYALHVIFSAIDEKETEQRFRDCWPVYEKKLEGVFRRVALDWIKQLVEANPNFFRDIRTEAIGGLLVNPGGERFISFLRQLSRFALFSKANKTKGLLKQQVLLPPIPTSDPEVTNRQMHLLESRVRENTEALCKDYKALLKNDMGFSLRLRILDEHHQKIQRINSIQSARLMSYINNYPELFGNPSEDEIKARDAAISSIKLQDIMENEDYDDDLRDRLELTLKKRCEEVYKPVSLLQDVMEDYGAIWHILEMDKSSPLVLDCSKFLPQPLNDDSTSPSLTSFLKTFLTLVDSFVSSEYLSSETPGDILQEYESASCRFSFLEMMDAEIKKNATINSKQMIKRMEMQLNLLKLRMDNFDWSLLSGIHEDDTINHLLDMSPLRVYDINRQSGRTPGINNFLDSSSSSSSGELQQTSIMRRRNAHLMKVKRTSEGSTDPTGHHLSYDFTDGPSRLNKSSRTSYPSDKSSHHSTPLSSTQIQSGCNSIRSSSLFHNSITGTPASAQSTSSSISSARMKKSVSFGDTPTGTSGESSFSSVISARHYNRKSSRFSSGPSSFSAGTSMLESPLGSGSRDASSRLSFASSTGTPVGILDTSTQERLNKLMKSVASSRLSVSLSPIASSEVDAADMSGDSTQPEHSPALLNESVDMAKSIDGTSFNECERAPVTDFGDISIIEDLEGMKGIMETSYVEFFRNSDSDD